MAYPTTLDSFTSPGSSDYQSSPAHSTQHANVNGAIASIEAKVGADSSAVTTSHDYKLSSITGVDKAMSQTGTETLTNKTLTSPVLNGNISGWTAATDTWAYITVSSFAIIGADRTGIFVKGTRLFFTQTTAKYAVVVSSAYAGGNTTVNIAVNTDYTLANAAITLPYYSYQISPQGYPTRFIYTAVITGQGTMSIDSTEVAAGYFSVMGNVCYVHNLVAYGDFGGTAVTYFHVTLPIAASLPGGYYIRIPIQVQEFSYAVMKAGFLEMTNGTTATNIYKQDMANWSLNSSTGIASAQFNYPI